MTERIPINADNCYVICPYCGYAHGDAWEMFKFAEQERDFTCNGCEKEFVTWMETSTTYYTRPAKVEQ